MIGIEAAVIAGVQLLALDTAFGLSRVSSISYDRCNLKMGKSIRRITKSMNSSEKMRYRVSSNLFIWFVVDDYISFFCRQQSTFLGT